MVSRVIHVPNKRVKRPEVFNLMTRFWTYLEEICEPNLDELAELRNYPTDHPFFHNTPDLRYCKVEENPKLFKALESAPPILNLTDPNSPINEFLLDNRWVTPVKLPDGTVVALIGWRPGMGAKMKYLTTPTPGFSKKFLLLGSQNLVNPKEQIAFVVEGVFDQMALNAMGIPAVSVMGRECTKYHQEQLKRLPIHVVGVPDRDAYDVIQYDKWGLGRYFAWNNTVPGKDMDDLVSMAGYDLKETLLQLADHKDYVVRIGASG